MSFWDWLFHRKQTSPVPPAFSIAVVVCDESNHPVADAEVRMDADKFIGRTSSGGVVSFMNFQRLSTTITVTKAGYRPYAANLDGTTKLAGRPQNICVGGACGATDILLPPLRRSFTKRPGVVRAVGKAVYDDQGFFHPLGLTMFWAYQGWTRDRERFKQNIAYIAKYNYDHVRVLGQVAWNGWIIDPNDAGYEQTWGELIDFLYDENGLRVEIAIIGDPYNDPMDVCRKLAHVLVGREHKIMGLEMTNEGHVDIPTMVAMARYMRVNTGVQLIALTSPGDVGLLVQAGRDAGATEFTVHPERDNPDGTGWRQAKQGWGSQDFPGVVNNNEPAGPHSSIAEQSNPLILTMMRANSVMCGAAKFILHVADMVAGQLDPAHNRHANIWEVPNIDEILRSVRAIDPLLPEGVENWAHSSQHGGSERVGPQPLLADAIWSDGAAHGVDRAYGATNGVQFIELLLGVLQTVDVIADRNMHVDVYNPLTHAIQMSTDIPNGGRLTLPGKPDTMCGYLILGRNT